MPEITRESTSETIPLPSRADDASPERLAEERYLGAIGKLVDDATANGQVGVLADVLAWTIARMIVGFGVPAAGDILRRIGSYVGNLSERRRAEEEAEQARKEGRAMH